MRPHWNRCWRQLCKTLHEIGAGWIIRRCFLSSVRKIVGRSKTSSILMKTHPSTSLPLVLSLSMKVTTPLEFMNMPWVMDTSESLRRLIPWFLNWCIHCFVFVGVESPTNGWLQCGEAGTKSNVMFGTDCRQQCSAQFTTLTRGEFKTPVQPASSAANKQQACTFQQVLLQSKTI